MSDAPFPLAYALIQYERLLHRLGLFLIDGNQKIMHKAITDYSRELHALNLQRKVLPTELKNLNKCIVPLLEKANAPFILYYFKLEMRDLKYV